MNSTIKRLIADVARLQPGQAIEVSRHILEECGCSQLVGMCGPTWTPVDRIMENVVGSAYEVVTREKPASRSVVFERLLTPLPDDCGRITYVSPDRRERFRRDGDYWVRVR